ncbi:MAG: hypothetical protein LBD53_09665 [Tannerella sp.]|jgi:hypothetical protein|nr:hypothetical protein [Tannerella sp.]
MKYNTTKQTPELQAPTPTGDSILKRILRQSLPHLAAIALFWGISFVYFAPEVLNDKAMTQGDVKGVSGWGKDLVDYREKTGDYAYWSNRMFGGMPWNYCYGPPSHNVFTYASHILYIIAPGRDMRYLFFYMLGFYIFMMCLGCKSWLGVIGAIGYTFATYNLIILEAGHLNKALVMATMAPVIGGIILCYRKKYITGALVTIVSLGLNIVWSHQQISYYLLIMILILAVVYLIYAIREKTVVDYFKSSAVLLVAAALAIAPEAGSLITKSDYTKDTMRGGSVLKQTAKGEQASSGLEIDYAYMWSYGQAETFTLLIPNLYGASSHYNLGSESELYQKLKPTGQADYAKYAPAYWGGDLRKSFTSGPVYVGAIICFLFVLGLIIVKGREKWWLLAATIASIILAWGRHFADINNFLFYHLPMYNKFRTPEMALVMAEVTMAALAILAFKAVFDSKDKRTLLKPLYISASITGGICLIVALFGSSLMSFSSDHDLRYPEWFVNALVSDRKSMAIGDAWRSLLLIAGAAGVLWFFISKKTGAMIPTLIIGVLIFIDLWAVDKRFINYDSFIPAKTANRIVPTEIDNFILKDNKNGSRVLNRAKDTFNEAETSFFHRSIGGYSPAKLRRYQDIIDYYLSGVNTPSILNMLNTGYVIMPTKEGTPTIEKNPDALGNAWFVSNIEWANSPDEEITALKDINPAQTAVIDKEWQSKLSGWEALQGADSTAAISLKEMVTPGNFIYESTSAKPLLAVFSEIFYKTWKAYIDGTEVTPVRVNYILRGLAVPAGAHKIEFKCIDEVYIKSARISVAASWISGLAVLGLLVFAVLGGRKDKNNSP